MNPPRRRLLLAALASLTVAAPLAGTWHLVLGVAQSVDGVGLFVGQLLTLYAGMTVGTLVLLVLLWLPLVLLGHRALVRRGLPHARRYALLGAAAALPTGVVLLILGVYWLYVPERLVSVFAAGALGGFVFHSVRFRGEK